MKILKTQGINGHEKNTITYYLEKGLPVLHSDGIEPSNHLECAGQPIVSDWHKNDLLHREGAPASIKWHSNGNVKSFEYYVEGLRHRADGPAIMIYDDKGLLESIEFHLSGEAVTPKDLEENADEDLKAVLNTSGWLSAPYEEVLDVMLKSMTSVIDPVAYAKAYWNEDIYDARSSQINIPSSRLGTEVIRTLPKEKKILARKRTSNGRILHFHADGCPRWASGDPIKGLGSSRSAKNREADLKAQEILSDWLFILSSDEIGIAFHTFRKVARRSRTANGSYALPSKLELRVMLMDSLHARFPSQEA